MEIDLKRRQAVMARSRKLGHCICNPQHPCPCPPFTEHNVCPCAGERMPKKTESVRLTQHVRKSGCASKIGQADLLQILSGLPPVTDPNVLLGTAAGDDAGVYRLDEKTGLVQTVDVFAPCVDDPYLFGQIAAANSVSDVYAMGGRPITALSIVGFPIDELDGAIMESMLRGGMDKLAEADCALIGGHSINDEEVKCGFAVTGIVDVEGPIARDNAQPGDVLILTKPLGTGMVSFAAQLGLISTGCLDEIGQWMAALNRDAAELMVKCGANACTDVTGYGLAGHLVSMMKGSAVDAEIDLSAVPVFAMAAECISREVFGGAVDRNQAYAMTWIVAPEEASASELAILYDPQTSGGLLISIPPEQGQAFLEEMQERGHTATAVIGRVLERSGPEPRAAIINPGLKCLIGRREAIDMSRKRPPEALASHPATASYDDAACCDSPPQAVNVAESETNTEESAVTDNASEALGLFSAFMKEANKPGLIDAKHKKLMAIVLGIAHHCHPCLRIHLEGAKKMGIPSAEIDEAANLAIAFGGCTSMMFYKEVRQEVGLG